jgi:hypothetical protein
MRPKQLGLCGPYRKQAERKRRRQGADAGHEHKIQSGGIRYLFDLSSTGVPTGKPSKTSKTVSAGFCQVELCVGIIRHMRSCFRGIESEDALK